DETPHLQRQRRSCAFRGATVAGATRLTMARWSPKLPTASVLNSWSLDDLPDPAGFWGAVGTATAQHLAPDDAPAWEQARLAVAAAIESYVRDAEDEASAVPIAAARERVAELRRAASALAQTVDAPRSPASAQAES